MGSVDPGSAFSSNTKGQDVQMCMFALQCLCIALPHITCLLSAPLVGLSPAGDEASPGLVNALNSSLTILRANTQTQR